MSMPRSLRIVGSPVLHSNTAFIADYWRPVLHSNTAFIVDFGRPVLNSIAAFLWIKLWGTR